MDDYKILPVGNSPALYHAVDILHQEGFAIADTPSQEVTHLLLPVPSFDQDGYIKGGIPLPPLLEKLSEDIHILGGNLTCLPTGYHYTDLLQDPMYVSRNAAITAHCAIRLAMQQLPVTLEGLPVAIIGWGRIGKCLARLLRSLDAQVTVYARKNTDRAMLTALGYQTEALSPDKTIPAALIFNTAPAAVEVKLPCNCLKIDLASIKGLPGEDVIWARGLPGKDAPVSSGRLIAQTVIPMITGKE